MTEAPREAGRMRDFWNQRAREDAYFFVDDREAYRATDLDRFWARGEEDLDRFLSALDLSVAADDVVVEVGCGVGRLTRVLAGRAREVLALDISEEMLERAREHHPQLTNVRWVASDGVSLAPAAPASADAVLSHVVFQHIPDPAITLGYVRDMGRVLRPGGWAAFQISNDPGVHRPGREPRGLGAVIDRVRGRSPRGRDNPAWLGSAIDLEELRSVAQEAGMTVVKVVNPGSQLCLVRLRREAG